MPDRMELRAYVDENRENVTLEMWREGEPLGHVLLSAPDVEQFINTLGKCRAALQEQVVPDLDPGARLEAIVDPAWKTPARLFPQGRMLALRHPALGWLSFLFPQNEAAKIADELTKDLPKEPE